MAEITEEEELQQLAPNLGLAANRLQRDWLVEKWLVNPGALVPGVRMPKFLWGTDGVSTTILGGDGRKQVEAIVDYLITLGEVPQPAAHARTERVEETN